MQWLIQDIGVPSELAIDQNSYRLLEIVKQKELPWFAVGIIPFSHEMTGLENVDSTIPSIFWGSTQACAVLGKSRIYTPGVFWHDDWWDPRSWIGKRSDLLNSELQTITAKELREHWITEPLFCKSVTVKDMTGDVLEVDKQDKDYWTIEFSHMDGNDELILSKPVRLQAEWRFFVVNGKIITGSMYRKEGIRRQMPPVEPEVWQAADKAVQDWMPCHTIVIDLALTEDNEYKVVEFNCINSSGWYQSDIIKIVDALEESVMECSSTQVRTSDLHSEEDGSSPSHSTK